MTIRPIVSATMLPNTYVPADKAEALCRGLNAEAQRNGDIGDVYTPVPSTYVGKFAIAYFKDGEYVGLL
jgi:hypothetical protein